MISQLASKGYIIKDPWDAVTIFEQKLAKYAGSDYAVCLDSCSNALFLCLKYLEYNRHLIEIPKNTYASVPMQIIHSGNYIRFVDKTWSGDYFLGNTPIVDGATRFRKNMYIQDTYYCVSFHHRKTLKIGRGGVVLTNNKDFVDWCRPMIYDGRHKDVMYDNDQLACIGYHMYMTPEDAAIGILKLDELPDYNNDTGNSNSYTDLSKQRIFDIYLR